MNTKSLAETMHDALDAFIDEDNAKEADDPTRDQTGLFRLIDSWADRPDCREIPYVVAALLGLNMVNEREVDDMSRILLFKDGSKVILEPHFTDRERGIIDRLTQHVFIPKAGNMGTVMPHPNTLQ